MLSCGAAAGIVLAALDPLLRRVLAPAVNRLGSLAPWQMTILAGVLIGIACWFAGRRRWRGFIGLRHLLTYPPLWVAGVAAVIVSLWVREWLGGVGVIDSAAQDLAWFAAQLPRMLWLSILLLLGNAVALSFWDEITATLRRLRYVPSPASDSQPGQVQESFETLCQWLRDDQPIDSPDMDLFHHNTVAQRMAARLNQDDKLQTMALIGPLGSGKTTICKLVRHELEGRRNVRLIQVSLWPFDSAEAAVRGILESIVEELGRHVNILPLVGLSEEYVAAIEKSAGRYGGIARLLRGTLAPQKILGQFARIARAVGLRLVLWIEDLERFTGGDQLKGDLRTQREVERLGPIRALLYLLDDCPQMSVVVADTSLHTRFDIGKIARFVEHVPRMDTELAWRYTNLVRTQCLGGHPVAVIDPAAKNTRQAFAPARSSSEATAWLNEFDDWNQSDIPGAIVRVLGTPRALKSALRIALEVWKNLPGEVDFDSMLVASVLREARPDLFALVDEYQLPFRFGLRNPFSRTDEKGKPHAVVDRIEELLKGEENGRTAAALRALLGFLSPAYATASRQKDGETPYGDAKKNAVLRPQAVFVEGHADYWRRYLAQAPVSVADSDQQALQDIRAWLEGRPSGLIDRVVDPKRGEQIVDFVGQFRPDDLCRLLDDVVERVKEQSAADWDNQSHAPGIPVVWQMMYFGRPLVSADAVHRTVVDVVKRIATIHLPLAADVVHYFTNSNPRVTQFMTELQQQEIRQQLRDAVAATFTGDMAEQRLAAALRDGSPWLMHWIVNRDEDNREALPCARWPEFSKVLLDLAERHPEIGVPPIVGLITRTEFAPDSGRDETCADMRRSVWTGEFDATAANRLFGDHSRLKRVLSQFEIPDHLDEQMKASCRAAIEGARTEVAAPESRSGM